MSTAKIPPDNKLKHDWVALQHVTLLFTSKGQMIKKKVPLTPLTHRLYVAHFSFPAFKQPQITHTLSPAGLSKVCGAVKPHELCLVPDGTLKFPSWLD